MIHWLGDKRHVTLVLNNLHSSLRIVRQITRVICQKTVCERWAQQFHTVTTQIIIHSCIACIAWLSLSKFNIIKYKNMSDIITLSLFFLPWSQRTTSGPAGNLQTTRVMMIGHVGCCSRRDWSFPVGDHSWHGTTPGPWHRTTSDAQHPTVDPQFCWFDPVLISFQSVKLWEPSIPTSAQYYSFIFSCLFIPLSLQIGIRSSIHLLVISIRDRVSLLQLPSDDFSEPIHRPTWNVPL